ncbi:hypothetical protein ACHAWF_012602 [Thalassiosira exigua]
MATATTPTGTKRPRSDAEEGPRDRLLRRPVRLSDFPDSLLAGIASYLPQTSCLRFAASFDTANDSGLREWLDPRSTSRASMIVAACKENWSSIDFGDVTNGATLNDDDLAFMLERLDAVNTVKSLKLTNCTGVLGTGLECLRDSIVLEAIDLSLVGLENPNIHPEPRISAEVVIPILGGILDKTGTSLVHIIFPKKWRANWIYDWNDPMEEFWVRFNSYLYDLKIPCMAPDWGGGICSSPCDVRDAIVHHDRFPEYRGITSITCNRCMKMFCTYCGALNFCGVCERFYCTDCVDVLFCANEDCEGEQPAMCRDCDVMEHCDLCNSSLCSDCAPARKHCQFCGNKYCQYCCYEDSAVLSICEGEGCGRANCNIGNCADGHRSSSKFVKRCDDCWTIYCGGCKLANAKRDGGDNCSMCA